MAEASVPLMNDTRLFPPLPNCAACDVAVQCSRTCASTPLLPSRIHAQHSTRSLCDVSHVPFILALPLSLFLVRRLRPLDEQALSLVIGAAVTEGNFCKHMLEHATQRRRQLL